MNGTIKSIYKGNIFPTERCGASNEEIKELSKQLRTAFDSLCSHLRKNQIELLEAFEEISVRLNVLYNEEFFAEGFKLGAKLVTEALTT